MLTEGINDHGALKFIFLAGGPGSGKNYVANQLFGIQDGMSFGSTGMKLVSLDRIFEKALEKMGYSKDLTSLPPDEFDKLTSQTQGSLRQKCRDLMKKQMATYAKQGLGMVYDGLGNIPFSYFQKKDDMEDMGYDSYLLFVDTSLETALKRNAQRARKLPDKLVANLHNAVEWNRESYEKEFGDNMIVINNDDGETLSSDLRRQIDKILTSPVKNPIGQAWLASKGTMTRHERPKHIIEPKSTTVTWKIGDDGKYYKEKTYQPSLFPVQKPPKFAPWEYDYGDEDSPYLDVPYPRKPSKTPQTSMMNILHGYDDFSTTSPWTTKPSEKDKFKSQSPRQQASQGGHAAPQPEHDVAGKPSTSLMHQTIRNPETGNDILIKTALGYPPNHPMHIAAQTFMKTKRPPK